MLSPNLVPCSSFDVHWKWAHSEVLSRRYSFALVTNIAPQKVWKEHPLFLLWCPLKMGTFRSVVPSLQLCSCYKHSTTKVWKEHPLYSSFDVHWKWARWEVLSRRYSFALVTNIAPQKVWKEHPLYSSFDVHWKWAHWEVLFRRYSFALVTNIAPQRFGKNIPYIPPLMSTENGHIQKCCPVATALLLLQT